MRRRGIVSGVGGIFGTEGGAWLPALGGQYAMAKAGGVVGPSSILRVVADAGTAGTPVSKFTQAVVSLLRHTSSALLDPWLRSVSAGRGLREDARIQNFGGRRTDRRTLGGRRGIPRPAHCAPHFTSIAQHSKLRLGHPPGCGC